MGRKHTEESKRKISESLKGIKRGSPTEEHKRKISVALKGIKRSDETKKKISEGNWQRGEKHYNFGKKLSEETKRRIGDAQIGKKISKEARKNMSDAHKGNICTEETRRKISVALKGKKSHLWRGGVSFGKYCALFNNLFKKIVRDLYNNRCFLCGKTEEKNGRKLDVHHVNYDKDCLCGSPCEFVPLCRKCHTKTNFNRQYWEDTIMCYLYPDRYFMVV